MKTEMKKSKRAMRLAGFLRALRATKHLSWKTNRVLRTTDQNALNMCPIVAVAFLKTGKRYLNVDYRKAARALRLDTTLLPGIVDAADHFGNTQVRKQMLVAIRGKEATK